MKVRFTPEAIRSVRDKRAWWIQHRQEAPQLLGAELAAVVARLRAGVEILLLWNATAGAAPLLTR